VVSRTVAGRREVIVIHRPHYDDWSLPKGKNEEGESDEECAIREVAEETGLRCDLGAELPSVRYRDRKDRLKEVRYWAMHATAGSLQDGNDEVDEVRWVPVVTALQMLTYVHDREVVAAWTAMSRP
jgi:8-oxo-dGTP diphosphatase